MLMIVMAVLLAAAEPTATAAGPTETVKGAVDQVFAGQDGSAVKKVSIAERRADIRKVAENLFDFQEMSRRSLGSPWDTVPSSEKQEFVRSFTSLIANSYLAKTEQYPREPIRSGR